MRFQCSFLVLRAGNDLITFCRLLEFLNYKNPFKKILKTKKKKKKIRKKATNQNPNTLCKTYHGCVYVATGSLYRCEPVNNRR